MRKSTFIGFEPSNTTAVPDILFDELLSELSGAELKVLLYIIRRTIGFKKSTDAISFSQFEDGIKTHEGKVLDKGCGLNRETISKALKSLESRHCIKSEKRAGSVTFYSICFKGDTTSEDTDQQTSRKNQLDQSKKPTSQLVGKSVTTSRKKSISLVGKSDPQLDSNTITQITTIQKERETTSPEQQFLSFTPSELILLQWIEEKNINIARDEVKVKSQLEELAPLAENKAELQGLIETAREIYPKINDLSLGNLVNKRVINAHAQKGGKKDTTRQPVAGTTFRADTAEYLRESANIQSCNEETALAEAQARFEQSGMSADAFDALITQAIMASVTQTYANGDAWLRHVTDYLDAELQPARQREAVEA